MDILNIISKKRSGNKLTKEEIFYFVNGYTNESIPDYQISSLLMSIFFQGMDDEEVSFLTEAFILSGDQVNLSSIPGIKVDKHSTGGIGDKVSIAISPIVASLGIPVAKMSGRGLGHTGGTVDKLESIPGFKVELSEQEFISQVKKINIAIVGQSSKLVPADKKFYALRDVTGTVESIPLIASSIMSKKIATGSDAILLDVKVGSGAFMKDVDSASKLVNIMLQIGKRMNRNIKAHITDMNEPLGRTIGNANEVIEAIETLKGKVTGDFFDIVIDSSATLIMMANKAENYDDAVKMVKDSINSGIALEKFYE
jgi:pyrimidine-nucleoside phosphorylase